MKIKELTSLEEMLAQHETITFLYPNMTIERYEAFLEDMIA